MHGNRRTIEHRGVTAFAACWLAAVMNLIVPGAQVSAQTSGSGELYSVQDLGSLPGYPHGAAVALNNAGQVLCHGSGFHLLDRGFLWSSGTYQDLGAPGDGWSVTPTALNDGGEVVGSVSDPTGNVTAFHWQAGEMSLLPLPDGYVHSAARAINLAGVIAGVVFNQSDFRAVIWDSAGVHPLPPLDAYAYSEANGINGSGTVVGTSYTDPEVRRPVSWANGGAADLGNVPGYTQGQAIAINDSGLVVGECGVTSFGEASATWSPSGNQSFGRGGGEEAVNSAGWVVAVSFFRTDGNQPVIWSQSTSMVELMNIAIEGQSFPDIVDSGSVSINDARAIALTVEGPNLGSNPALLTLNPNPLLSLEITSDRSSASVGDEVKLQVSVTNTGQAATDGLRVLVPLPAGLVVETAQAPIG